MLFISSSGDPSLVRDGRTSPHLLEKYFGILICRVVEMSRCLHPEVCWFNCTHCAILLSPSYSRYTVHLHTPIPSPIASFSVVVALFSVVRFLFVHIHPHDARSKIDSGASLFLHNTPIHPKEPSPLKICISSLMNNLTEIMAVHVNAAFEVPKLNLYIQIFDISDADDDECLCSYGMISWRGVITQKSRGNSWHLR